jgi:hypothetical protein
VPIGWAAKIVNMLTKIHVYVAGRGSPKLRGLIHPPIDNLLVNAILKKYSRLKQAECRNRDEIIRLCSMGKPIKSVTTYGRYLEVIEGLNMVAESEGWTLFETESLWDDAAVQLIRAGRRGGATTAHEAWRQTGLSGGHRKVRKRPAKRG